MEGIEGEYLKVTEMEHLESRKEYLDPKEEYHRARWKSAQRGDKFVLFSQIVVQVVQHQGH